MDLQTVPITQMNLAVLHDLVQRVSFGVGMANASLDPGSVTMKKTASMALMNSTVQGELAPLSSSHALVVSASPGLISATERRTAQMDPMNATASIPCAVSSRAPVEPASIPVRDVMGL